jgi:hypothetical protein
VTRTCRLCGTDFEGASRRSVECYRCRLLSKVVQGDGCWRWKGGQNGPGYSMFWLDGQMRYAHRLVYELLVGPIPEGLELDHLCRNRACVNPAHLEPVTHSLNVLRGTSGTPEATARRLASLRANQERGRLERAEVAERIAAGRAAS